MDKYLVLTLTCILLLVPAVFAAPQIGAVHAEQTDDFLNVNAQVRDATYVQVLYAFDDDAWQTMDMLAKDAGDQEYGAYIALHDTKQILRYYINALAGDGVDQSMVQTYLLPKEAVFVVQQQPVRYTPSTYIRSAYTITVPSHDWYESDYVPDYYDRKYTHGYFKDRTSRSLDRYWHDYWYQEYRLDEWYDDYDDWTDCYYRGSCKDYVDDHEFFDDAFWFDYWQDRYDEYCTDQDCGDVAGWSDLEDYWEDFHEEYCDDHDCGDLDDFDDSWDAMWEVSPGSIRDPWYYRRR